MITGHIRCPSLMSATPEPVGTLEIALATRSADDPAAAAEQARRF